MRKDGNYSLPSSAFWDITSTNDNQWPVSGLFFFLYESEALVQLPFSPSRFWSTADARVQESRGGPHPWHTLIDCGNHIAGVGGAAGCLLYHFTVFTGQRGAVSPHLPLTPLRGLRFEILFPEFISVSTEATAVERDPNLDGSSCCHLHLSPQTPAFQLQWASEVNCWDTACQENWPQTETTPWLKLKLHTSHAFLTGAFMEIEPQCLHSLLLHSLFMMLWTRKQELDREARKGRGPSYQQPVLL